jgi:glutathione S-transferase
MIVLYDNPASVAAQKVRLVLAEKSLEWQTVPIDLRNGDAMKPSYLALNPAGVVPTIESDGEVLTESSIIIEYLDDLAPEPPLRPSRPLERARMRAWMRRIDDTVQRAIGNLSMAVYIRDAHLAKPREEREAYFARMPDRDRAERQQAAIEFGTAAPQFGPAIRVLSQLVDDLDRSLGDREWLVGDRFSLADIAVAPYVTRLDMLAMDPLWRDGRRPRMHRWWERIVARDSWQRQVRDAFPSAARERVLARGREAWPVIARHADIT